MPISPVRLMLATPAERLREGLGWTYEVKWDGYRTQAIKDGAHVRLISRNLKTVTRQYPAVAAAIAGLKANQVLLDGELVAVDADGS